MSMDIKARNSFDCGVSLLNSKQYYDQSVHCFYFSIIQLMKYKLANLKNNAVDYADQDNRSTGGSSHDWLMTQMFYSFSNRKDGNHFQDVFLQMKRLRKLADYGCEHISLDQCLDCRELREKAENYLRAVH